VPYLSGSRHLRCRSLNVSVELFGKRICGFPFSLAPARGPAATFAVSLGAVRHQGQHSLANFATRLTFAVVKPLPFLLGT
jgi:hypothetical protein